MASFQDAVDELVTILSGDTVLNALCNAKWGKGITVQQSYKTAAEADTADLPVIMISQPKIRKTPGGDRTLMSEMRDSVHVLRLLCGFQDTNWETGAENLVLLEETVDSAILAHYNLNNTVQYAKPKVSKKDTESSHPLYFVRMDIELYHRK